MSLVSDAVLVLRSTANGLPGRRAPGCASHRERPDRAHRGLRQRRSDRRSRSSTPATWSSRRASSTRTCTSTSRAAPSGKASTRRPRAAAAGGVTTLVDMPLNSIPATTTVAALHAKREAARAQCHVDVGFWGGVVPGNAGELDALVDAGVRGLQVLPRAVRRRRVSRGGRGRSSRGAADPRASQRAAARPRGVAGMRLRARTASPTRPRSAPRPRRTRPTWRRGPPAGRSRGDPADGPARRGVRGAASTSSTCRPPRAWRQIAAAKAASVPITAETCPHYLTFAAEEIAGRRDRVQVRAADSRRARIATRSVAGASTAACSIWSRPTIRRRRRAEVPGGVAISCAAWGGIASLELSLPASGPSRSGASAQARASGASASVCSADLARWMSAAPASLAGLGDRKGRSRRASTPTSSCGIRTPRRVVDPSRLQQRHKLTPYAGRLARAAPWRRRSSAANACGTRTGSTRAYGGRLL